MTDEERRHQCEVRHWLAGRAEKGKEWLRDALNDIEERRGARAADRLREDIRAQWSAGNRGAWGDWRTTCETEST